MTAAEWPLIYNIVKVDKKTVDKQTMVNNKGCDDSKQGLDQWKTGNRQTKRIDIEQMFHFAAFPTHLWQPSHT